MEDQLPKSPIARVIERLREISDRLSNVQKMAVSALMIALVLGVALAVWFANDHEYATLYSDLDEQQAGKVTEELKTRNVKYQLSAGGTTVMVPSDQVYELRLQLASTGVTSGTNVGYELIDQNKFFGMPADVIDVTKKRMMEGELARSVSSLAEVAAARVHLATPKKTIFVEDQRPPSASVVVQLEPGSTLTPYQVKGVVNLVSGAVTDLEPENVTVVDQRGKVLNRKTPDSVEGGTTFEYQQTLERTLESKATEVLERIVGAGRAVVRVRATLDFSREERTEELYNPDGQVVRSEESLNEIRQNGGNRVGGAAGAAANNQQTAQGVVRVGDASNANREKVITNYEINKVVKRVKGPSAQIKRLSIAVLVANKMVTPTAEEGKDGDEAVPQPTSEPRTKEELLAIEQLVKQAVGFHATDIRKDVITVQNVEFTDEDTKLAEAQLRAAELREAVRFWTRMGIVLVVALLLVFLVFRPMVRTLTEQPELAEVLDGQLPKTEDAALPGEEIFDESEYEMVPISEKLVAYCKANPQTAADVLAHWLRSDAKQHNMHEELEELEESAA